jgi:hypothetical protein
MAPRLVRFGVRSRKLSNVGFFFFVRGGIRLRTVLAAS